MKVLLKDVAARAGVAINTASTILNRRPNSWASKETEARVFKAAAELGYRPNPAARALRWGRFNTLGLVIPDLHNPFYTGFADIMEREAEKRGFDLLLESWRNSLEREKHCLDDIVTRQVDGAAFFLSSNDSHRPFLEDQFKKGRPFTALSVFSGMPLPVDCVLTDFAQGLRDAIDVLYSLGHRRFAFLSALIKGQDDGSRHDLFAKLLAEHGIARGNFDVLKCNHTVADSHRAASELLRATRDHRPTAIVAMNDLSAIAVMRAAAECRLRVPHDISIVGVDNIELGMFLPTTLSTIGQPITDMARKTVSLLVDHVENPGAKTHREQVVFPTAFIRRESVGIAQRLFAKKRKD